MHILPRVRRTVPPFANIGLPSAYVEVDSCMTSGKPQTDANCWPAHMLFVTGVHRERLLRWTGWG